jgi:GNAT superfamily N-acetyltransferase
MLQPAHVGHLPVLRALIRDGAAHGAFDRALAGDSRDAALFFANLRQALNTGYFVVEDPKTGDLTTVAVPGYVYLPDRGGASSQPIGFGLFRATDIGFELWLTGVDAAWRGHGHGRAMMQALLATPPGKKAYVVRVNRFGRDSPAMAHLLATFQYTPVIESPSHAWYLRNDAPPELGRRMRDFVPESVRAPRPA